MRGHIALEPAAPRRVASALLAPSGMISMCSARPAFCVSLTNAACNGLAGFTSKMTCRVRAQFAAAAAAAWPSVRRTVPIRPWHLHPGAPGLPPARTRRIARYKHHRDSRRHGQSSARSLRAGRHDQIDSRVAPGLLQPPARYRSTEYTAAIRCWVLAFDVAQLTQTVSQALSLWVPPEASIPRCALPGRIRVPSSMLRNRSQRPG